MGKKCAPGSPIDPKRPLKRALNRGASLSRKTVPRSVPLEESDSVNPSEPFGRRSRSGSIASDRAISSHRDGLRLRAAGTLFDHLDSFLRAHFAREHPGARISAGGLVFSGLSTVTAPRLPAAWPRPEDNQDRAGPRLGRTGRDRLTYR
jgi:hypothetical protein